MPLWNEICFINQRKKISKNIIYITNEEIGNVDIIKNIVCFYIEK